MATLSFTAGAASQSTYGADLAEGSWYCKKTDFVQKAKVMSVTFTPYSEVKTLTLGDSVHALPFTGYYTEHKPMSGQFSCTARVFKGVGGGIDYAQCGENYGSRSAYTGDIGYYIQGVANSIPLPVPAPGAVERLISLANTKACADLRRSLFNAPLIIAERRETIAMLRKKGLQIASVVKHRQAKDLARWARTRRRDKRLVARDIASEHLALLFGFLPLIDEINGIAASLSDDVPVKITGRGRASDVAESVTSLGNSTSTLRQDNAFALYEGGLTSMVRFSARTSVSCTVTMSGAQYIRDAGFNPLAAFYDLIPLSFLSEFVSNLGTFIRALDPLVGVDFLTGSTTTWIERHDTARVFGTYKRVNNYSYGRPDSFLEVSCSGSGEASTRVLQVQRSVLTDYPEPSLHWVNNMSLAKAGTIASLAVQRYLKPVQRLLAAKAFRYKGSRPKYLPPINYR